MQHHAYIYEGPLALLPALGKDARARFNFAGEHSPDVHVREFEKFGIDESRWLSQTAALRGAAGRALFVIGAGSLTGESQQALLKLLEEPQEGSIFVLLVPHGTLLPTLRSRTAEYPELLVGAAQAGPNYFAGQAAASKQSATKFLKADQKTRSVQIAALLKDDEGAKERVRELLLGLEGLLVPHIASAQARQALSDIQKVRSYVGDRSAALKMLLEHLALALPRI